MDLRITSNAKQFQRGLNNAARKQVPFAMSLAINDVLSEIMRHLCAWIEGEDLDPKSGLSHLTKAMTSLAVLRDAQIQGTAIDDRPRPSPPDLIANLNTKTEEINARLRAAESE